MENIIACNESQETGRRDAEMMKVGRRMTTEKGRVYNKHTDK
jgi:hypothetical protein